MVAELIRDAVALSGFFVIGLLVRRNHRSAQRLNQNLLLLANHEIRTPLTVIHGVLQTIRNGADQLSPDARASLLHSALHRSEEVLRLIDTYMRLEEVTSRSAPRSRIVRPIARFKRDVA